MRPYSQTQLNTFLKCGEQYYRRYVKGHKIPPGLPLLRGDGQHKAQERDLGTKLEKKVLAPEEELLDVASDRVRERAQSADDVRLDDEEKSMGFKKARDRTIDQAVRATQIHHRNFAPVIEPAILEAKLEFPIPYGEDDSRDVIAYLDLVEADHSIRDTKTAMKRPTLGDADESDQLGLYAFGYRKVYGIDSPVQSLDYLVLSKAQNPTEFPIPKKAQEDPTAHIKAASLKLARELSDGGLTLMGLNGRDRAIRVPGTQSHDSQARSVLRLQEAVAGIEAGYFSPAPNGVWWCSKKWCGFHDTCPYVRGGASVLVPGVNDEQA